MTYTAEERKIIHAQLVAAKPYLWRGRGPDSNKESAICLAISKGAKVLYLSEGKNLLACKMIAERLNYKPSLFSWLRDVVGIPYHRITDVSLQKHRHNWLDHLIKEFSE